MYSVRADLVTLKIELDETGGSDLAEHQYGRIDQEMMFRTRHAGRDMGEDQIIPSEHGDDAITRSKVHAP